MEVILENKIITYSVRKSARAKSLRISIHPDMRVVLTVPFGMHAGLAENFIKAKQSWILKSLLHFQRRPVTNLIKSSKADYKLRKPEAEALVKAKVNYWNKIYNFPYRSVSVKNQKTRWGSCSKKGNLNFNYNIVKLPEKLVDYLVVHELCHLKELNHSKNFWRQVARTIPNFKELRQELKKNTVR